MKKKIKLGSWVYVAESDNYFKPISNYNELDNVKVIGSDNKIFTCKISERATNEWGVSYYSVAKGSGSSTISADDCQDVIIQVEVSEREKPILSIINKDTNQETKDGETILYFKRRIYNYRIKPSHGEAPIEGDLNAKSSNYDEFTANVSTDEGGVYLELVTVAKPEMVVGKNYTITMTGKRYKTAVFNVKLEASKLIIKDKDNKTVNENELIHYKAKQTFTYSVTSSNSDMPIVDLKATSSEPSELIANALKDENDMWRVIIDNTSAITKKEYSIMLSSTNSTSFYFSVILDFSREIEVDKSKIELWAYVDNPFGLPNIKINLPLKKPELKNIKE